MAKRTDDWPVPSPAQTQKDFENESKKSGLKVLKALPPDLKQELRKRFIAEGSTIFESIVVKVRAPLVPDQEPDEHILGDELVAFYQFCEQINISPKVFDVGEVFSDIVSELIGQRR